MDILCSESFTVAFLGSASTIKILRTASIGYRLCRIPRRLLLFKI